MSDVLVRASSLTEWPDCERRFAARHLLGMVEAAGYQLRRVPEQIGAKIGTAVHAGAAEMLRGKIANGELGPKHEAVDMAVECLRSEVSVGTSWDDVSRTINDAEQQTKRMVEVYHGVIAPTLAPVEVEQEYTARFSPTLRLIGHMDIAEDQGVDDNKTGVAQRPHHPQYGAYSLLRRSTGATVSRFREHWVPRAPMSRPQPQPVTTTYAVETCEQAAQAVLKKVDAAIKDFAATGDIWQFIPNPSSMLCSDKYCPAHGTAFCTSHKQKS